MNSWIRRYCLLATVFLIALPLYAVSPESWSVDTSDQFLSGDVSGFGVTSRGDLVAAPSLRKIGDLADPFVYAAATDPSGNRYFGTGNAGKVYRMKGDKIDLLFTAPEPEVYALTFADGALWVGTSPNGKVYRVDPSTGASTVWFDPKDTYIWALAPAGSSGLYVATGLPAHLYKVTKKGTGEVWFTASEPHLRSIAVRPDGSLLLGGSGKGGIYEVTGKDEVRALFDAELSEISAIAVDPATGVAWAAGATSTLPTAPPPHAQTPATTSSTTKASSGKSSESSSQEGKATVDVSFSFRQPTATLPEASGSSEIYRIDPDGYVERVWKFDHDVVYAIGIDGKDILISTGPKGRLYRYRDGEAALVASVAEKQIVSYSVGGGRVILTTTNGGAVYNLSPAPAGTSEYRSPVEDTDRFSRFGQYRIEGEGLAASGLAISFRSGNTLSPDSTWSDWSSPAAAIVGMVSAPGARFLQFRLTAKNFPRTARIDSVDVAFVNRNAAPVIDGFDVDDPGVVFITSTFPPPPSVVEATNPDENGIFTSIDNPKTRNDPGKRYFRKGYRTLSWHAHDPNGDRLKYDLYFRRDGAKEWLRLRTNLTESQYNFDSSQLPDGRYEARLVVSDAPDNPVGSLTTEREGVTFEVDNTPPVITSRVVGKSVEIRIADASSPLVKAEYSVDAKKWIPLVPEDGILDGQQETFKLKRGDLEGHFVTVRALDASFNVATASLQ